MVMTTMTMTTMRESSAVQAKAGDAGKKKEDRKHTSVMRRRRRNVHSLSLFRSSLSISIYLYLSYDCRRRRSLGLRISWKRKKASKLAEAARDANDDAQSLDSPSPQTKRRNSGRRSAYTRERQRQRQCVFACAFACEGEREEEKGRRRRGEKKETNSFEVRPFLSLSIALLLFPNQTPKSLISIFHHKR
jgi:hypothetical protein